METEQVELVPLDQHPSNLDPTARLEWADAKFSVYSVRGGHVAVFGAGLAALPLFSTIDAARNFLMQSPSRPA